MKFIILSVALLSVIALATSQSATCVEVINVQTSSCGNVTENSNAIPKKACVASGSDINAVTYCSDDSYGSWLDGCPLKNTGGLNQFCQGKGFTTGGADFPAPCGSLRSCNSDDDCVDPPTASAPGPSYSQLCYNCCTPCHSDCASMSGQGKLYASEGETECYKCSSANSATLTQVCAVSALAVAVGTTLF